MSFSAQANSSNFTAKKCRKFENARVELLSDHDRFFCLVPVVPSLLFRPCCSVLVATSSCRRRRGSIRDLKQTTTATATRTWKNKRSNCQNTCVLKLCTFLSRPRQNNKVKSPQFASSANRNRNGKFL